MKKKILFIEPKPSAYNVYSAFYLPRLGLPLLGAILKKHGYHVDIYLQNKNNVPIRKIREADLVGITTTTSTCYEAYKIARLARSFGKPVVLGGSHVTFKPEEGLQHADVVVRNEGEAATPRVVEALVAGAPLDDIPGISFIRDGEIISTPDAPFISDLDALPFPDLSLIRGRGKVNVAVQTSRGCPHRCVFCSVTPMFGHKYRFRSPENVVEELAMYRDQGIFFCDDNFTAVPSHTRELLELMREKKVGLKGWSAQTRVEIARDDELLALMRSTGCGYVYIGFESVNPRTLEQFNKKQDVDDIRHCIERYHHHGIGVHGMFVLGSDEDDAQTVRDTLTFANKMKIDSVQFLTLTPLPGTKTYAELKSAKRIFTFDWRLYDGHHVVYTPKLMTAKQLQETSMQAMLDFYSLPSVLSQAAQRNMRNLAVRFLGFHLVREAIFHNRDFAKGIDRNEFLSAQASPRQGFIFDDGGKWVRMIQFMEKLDSGLKVPGLKILYSEELKTRASFLHLKGVLEDFSHSNLVALSVLQSVLKGKTSLVINFNLVKSIKPRALKYLAKCLATLEKLHRSLFIVGLDPPNRSLMLAACNDVPCFEFFDTEDALLKYLVP